MKTRHEYIIREGLLDTKPIPVIGYRRSKQRSDFLGSAAFGYGASKKMYYLFADKGFLGQAWQADIQHLSGNCVWTPKRKNQAAQQSHVFERWFNGLRLRIEGLFNEIQNVGRNVDRLLAKTVRGLCARIAAKMASHLLKYVLRYNFGIDVLSFSQIDA